MSGGTELTGVTTTWKCYDILQDKKSNGNYPDCLRTVYKS